LGSALKHPGSGSIGTPVEAGISKGKESMAETGNDAGIFVVLQESGLCRVLRTMLCSFLREQTGPK